MPPIKEEATVISLGMDLETALTRVVEGECNAVNIARKVLDDGKEAVSFSIENRRLNPEPPPAPDRAETPRRAHVFHEAAGFARYLEQYATEHTIVLADVGKRLIAAVLDESLTNGVEVITMVPQLHPLFEPWAALLARDTEIMAFAKFVMQQRRVVIDPDGRDLALTLSQVSASSTYTLNRGHGNKSINGLIVETVIQGNKRNEPVDLPDSITIEVPLFVGCLPVQIEIDLLLHAPKPDQIMVTAVSALLMEAMTNTFMQMLADIETTVSEAKCALGSLAHTSWDYLKAPTTPDRYA